MRESFSMSTLHYFHFLLLRYIFLFFVFSATTANANCEDPAQKYLCEQDPKKIALVIGNENYESLPVIQSSKSDGMKMTNRLTELGFDVLYYPDVDTVNRRAIMTHLGG